MNISSFINVFFFPKKVLNDNMQSYNLFFPAIIIGCTSAVLGNLIFLFVSSNNVVNSDMQYIKTIMMVFTAVLGMISPLLSILINSIINYIVLMITDTFVEFRKLMIIGFYAYMPILLDSFIRLLVTMYTGEIFPYSPTSLAVLLSKPTSIIYAIVNSFSICGLWSIGIYIFGVSLAVKETNFNKHKKAMVVVSVINVVLIIVVGLMFTSIS